MKHTLNYFYYFSMTVVLPILFMGCSDSKSPGKETIQPVNNAVVADLQEAVAVPDIKHVVSNLRKDAPDDILDNEWITLKKILNFEKYLDFISPQDESFESFDDFIEGTIPSGEGYELFLKKEIKSSEPVDIQITHNLTLAFLSDKISGYHGNHRNEADQELVKALITPEVINWMSLRFSKNGKLDSHAWVNFIIQHRFFARDLEMKTQSQIKELREQYGTDRGMLYFSVLAPARISWITNNFTDLTVFDQWVKGELF